MIGSEELLTELALRVNEGHSYAGCWFSLSRDINLSQQWMPIGTAEHSFSGVFDGNGYCVSGLYVEDQELAGFFGKVIGGEIRKLKIKGSINGEIAGAVAACAENTLIEHCVSDAAVSAAESSGGILGTGDSSSRTRSSYSLNSVAGTKAMAIAGGQTMIENCYFLYGRAPAQDGAAAKTAQEFSSGQVAL